MYNGTKEKTVTLTANHRCRTTNYGQQCAANGIGKMVCYKKYAVTEGNKSYHMVIRR